MNPVLNLERIDPRYVRFLHMKILGEPLDKLKEQAASSGLDPTYLDKDFPDYRQFPEYQQFFEERKCGVAIDVLKEKMLQRGLDDNVLDIYDMGESQMIRVDYVKYVDWFRRKEAGEDIQMIRSAMEQEGLDASYLDHDINSIEFVNIPYSVIINGDMPNTTLSASASLKLQSEVQPAAPATPTTCQHKYVKMVDYKYYKQFKLLNMGRPKEQLKARLEAEGMDSSILDMDMNTIGFLNIPDDEEVKYPDGHVEPCCKPGQSAAPATPTTCQHKYVKMVDYKYYKQFKLLNMGRPKEQLKARLEAEGMDSSILDMDMNTIGFLNIPDGEEVKYPDGHVEPCCKPGQSTSTTPTTCQHKYVKMVDYKYYKQFKLLNMGRPKEQLKARLEAEGMDSSILDMDMNTIGFLNIPDDEEVKYPDGHVEPCCKPGQSTAPTPAPTPVTSAPSLSQSSVLSNTMNLYSTMSSRRVEEKMEPRKKFTHKAKLRPVYWDVISSKSVIENSLWFKLDDHKVNLDTKMLDQEFTTKQVAPIVIAEPKTQSEKVSTLLDAKREQNVGIAIGRLPVSVDEIHHALLFADFKVLTKDVVIKLVNAAPTPEEQAVCAAYQGDVEHLSKASQFAYKMSDIPGIADRLICCKVITTFDDEIDRLEQTLEIYYSTERMIRENKGLQQLLEIILALGNYLNGDSARGGAWGFRLEFLTKMGNTKSCDNTKTLMT